MPGIIHCKLCGIPCRNKSFCSTACSNQYRSRQPGWNPRGASGMKGRYKALPIELKGLTLRGFTWVCHCGAEWKRTPGTKPPCRHADMARLKLTVEAL